MGARQLVARLDAAGIARAVVLFNACYFDPIRRGREAYPQVHAENDWTAQQVAAFPDRLIAFCSFSPLKDYAIEELERCARSGAFKGLKLHFAHPSCQGEPGLWPRARRDPAHAVIGIGRIVNGSDGPPFGDSQPRPMHAVGPNQRCQSCDDLAR